LADDLKKFAEGELVRDAALRGGKDGDLRRRVQSLARARGLSLEQGNVVIAYGVPLTRAAPENAAADARSEVASGALPVGQGSGGETEHVIPVDKFETFEALVEIGYTLPIRLPLFGIFPFTLFAVRTFPVRSAQEP
jgi:hypothetical protein